MSCLWLLCVRTECLDEERAALAELKRRVESSERALLDSLTDQLSVDLRTERARLFGPTPTKTPTVSAKRRSLIGRRGSGAGLSGRLSGLLLSPLLHPDAILARANSGRHTASQGQGESGLFSGRWWEKCVALSDLVWRLRGRQRGAWQPR